jgi:hypothetical protein
MGSISDAATGIFHWHNPSAHIIALGSTQPLTEMSTLNTSWRKGDQSIGLKILLPSYADCLEILEPQPHGTLRVYPGLYRDCSTFLLHYSLPSRLHNKHLLLHVQKICHCPYHKPCKPFSSSGHFYHFLGHLKPLSEVCLMITLSAKLLLSGKMAVTSRWLMMKQT